MEDSEYNLFKEMLAGVGGAEAGFGGDTGVVDETFVDVAADATEVPSDAAIAAAGEGGFVVTIGGTAATG